MNLVIFDELTNEEIEIIKSKCEEGANFLRFGEIDLNLLEDYKNITIYSGLYLNFISQNFINFVAEIIKRQSKKMQINVIFVEKFNENAKIAIDWLCLTNQTFMTKFNVISEISRENLKDEMVLSNSTKAEIKDNNVKIYTDGACSGNPGAGGWGAILFHGDYKKEISGFESETTNNKMEITAVIKALELLKAPCSVELYSDSAYVVNAINLGWLENWKANGWKGSDKKPVKNIEYWERLDTLMQIHKVTFVKVKGHADNEFNNRCDELATGEIAKNANN